MYENILVINLMQLGDLMLTTPVLRTLRTNYPKARLTLLADGRFADLVRWNKHVDECIFMDKRGKDKGMRSMMRFIAMVRSRHFDLVINLHRNERASALAAFSGAKRIVGYSKPCFSMKFHQVLPNLKAVKHQVHSHFDVLVKAAGVTQIDDGGLEMWIPEEAERVADKLWKENFREGSKVVAFNIGASWMTKRWIADYFAECADRLVEAGYAVAFFGGPMDLGIVRDCVRQMNYQPARDEESLVRIFTGKVSLAELGALFRRCCLLLTTDSGPMHIGVAMNVPIVTMFGSSPVPGFYPYDAKDILIKTPEPCHPCGMHDCPRKGRDYMACMKNIPVDVVMRYVSELLQEYGGKPACELPAHDGQYKCRVVEL